MILERPNKIGNEKPNPPKKLQKTPVELDPVNDILDSV